MNDVAVRTQSIDVTVNDDRVDLHFLEWGDPKNPDTLVCAHGLTRNAHDFDFLARDLQQRYRVVCIDYPGRGRSQWLNDPNHYGVPFYAQGSNEVIRRLAPAGVSWLGTSMGGLIGMALASSPDTRVRRLILNDVGPLIPSTALARINGYVGSDPAFTTLDDFERYLRQVHEAFGDLSDEHWAHLAEHGHRIDANGQFRPHYDPKIAQVFAASDQDIDLWPMWDAIICPTLVIRGAESDLLSADTAHSMTQRGPRAELHTVAATGHAPSLMTRDQIETIKDWLLRQQP